MEWIRGPIVGRGSSSTVFLGTNHSGELFAVKSSESNTLQREYKLVSELNSPFLVKCLGFNIAFEQDKEVYNMFMEYVRGGTLSDLIKKQGGSLDESMIKSYAQQILQGLDYLHSVGIVHCDVKGQNILIDENGNIKIADLGCGKFLADGSSGFSGTPAFMAPEVARGEEQLFPADIWAFGCTIIEMATGSVPWSDIKDPVSALYRIGYSEDLPQFPNSLSNDARDFLSKCLIKCPKERWTAKQLLQHPFLQSVEFNSWKDEELKRDSPTSILDQGFWNSFEVMESSSSLESTNAVDSAADRIRGLIGNEGMTCSLMPDWVEEEDWITVRCNDTEEKSIISEQNYELIDDSGELLDMETSGSIIFSEHDFVASINLETNLVDCIDDEIISIFHTGSSSRMNLITSPDSVGDVYVSEFNDSEMQRLKLYCSIEILVTEFTFSFDVVTVPLLYVLVLLFVLLVIFSSFSYFLVHNYFD